MILMSDLAEIVEKIGGRLGSPRVVDDIDRVLVHLLSLRKMAADLHGISAEAPVVLASERIVERVEPLQRAEPSEKNRPASDLNMPSLVHLYRTDPRSPYHTIRHKTRENYDGLIRRILADFGPVMLADLKKEDFERHYMAWRDRGKAMAHSLITMVRLVMSFGASTIGDVEAMRLSIILHKLKFDPVGPREGERLTVEHARLIREQAHKENVPSMALAQALQWDCKLGQKDVIGEWAPLREQGPPTEIRDGDLKWMRGLRWSSIDDDMVLRHVTSAQQQTVEIELRKCPAVLAELRRLLDLGPEATVTRDHLPRSADPIVVDELTGQPYLTHVFRRRWRALANNAGLPKEVRNTDSRLPNYRRATTSAEKRSLPHRWRS
jgi:hypothetical protein